LHRMISCTSQTRRDGSWEFGSDVVGLTLSAAKKERFLTIAKFVDLSTRFLSPPE
jgi:hypothetical protein